MFEQSRACNRLSVEKRCKPNPKTPRYDEMLWCLGYRTMQHTLTPLERFRFGVVFMVTYILALGAMIATT